MARASKMSVQKRLRERKKSEKAALKREQRREAKSEAKSQEGDGADRVADWDDLASYGLVNEPPEDAKGD